MTHDAEIVLIMPLFKFEDCYKIIVYTLYLLVLTITILTGFSY